MKWSTGRKFIKLFPEAQSSAVCLPGGGGCQSLWLKKLPKQEQEMTHILNWHPLQCPFSSSGWYLIHKVSNFIILNKRKKKKRLYCWCDHQLSAHVYHSSSSSSSSASQSQLSLDQHNKTSWVCRHAKQVLMLLFQTLLSVRTVKKTYLYPPNGAKSENQPFFCHFPSK